MALSKQTRNEMEDLIYRVFTALDKTGVNTEKYRKMFEPMSDAQFETFFDEKIFADDNQYLILDTVDYERDLMIEDIEKAAKILNVPLFEYLVMPDVNHSTENPVVTKHEVPVGYAPIKRPQQRVTKKNTTSTEASMRSALTGQVTGRDKNSRTSDTENYSLVALGTHELLRELNGPRSDDLVMKNEMYSEIAKKGYVELNSLTNKVENKTTLNALDVYLIGMGIKSDLVTEGLYLKRTLDKRS